MMALGARDGRALGRACRLIAAVAIVVALATVKRDDVALATAKRDDVADLGACPQGRADVALLVSGSVRSFMIPNVLSTV